MSRENNNVLKQVHQTIRDLKADLNDRGSVTSKRTNRSGSSGKLVEVWGHGIREEVQTRQPDRGDKS